jgi:hypothetical protein
VSRRAVKEDSWAGGVKEGGQGSGVGVASTRVAGTGDVKEGSRGTDIEVASTWSSQGR